MLAHSTEKKMIELLGNKFDRSLDTNNMLWALNKLEIMHSTWCRDGLWKYDSKALLCLQYFFDSVSKRKKVNYHPIHGHYIVYANGKYYDPASGIRNELYDFRYSRDWITVRGYLSIYD